MKNLIRCLTVVIGFLLSASFAGAQYVNVQVNFTTIKHWETSACWETGNEEYSALIYANLDGGGWQGGQCFQIDYNGDQTQSINYTPINQNTLATTLGTRLNAWEDDGTRCSVNSGDDCVNDDSWSHTIRTLSRATWNSFSDFGTSNHRFSYQVYWNWLTPPAPSVAVASSVAASSFTANWSNSDGNYRVTNYRLTVATDSGFSNIVSGYNNLDVGTSTSRSVTGLNPGSTYYYRVTSANEAGTSGNSGTTSTTLPKLDQTITFTAPSTKTYGDADFGLGATASSGLGVSYSILSGPATLNGGNLTVIGAGTVSVRASQSGNSSYNAAPNVDRSFTVNAKALTITAAAKSKVYGDGDPALTYSTNGLVGSDTTSGALTRDAGSTIGAYAISQGTVTAGTNYSTTYNGSDLTISPKPLTVTGVAVTTKTYDGSTAATVTGSLVGVVGGDTVTLSGTGIFNTKAVGSDKPVTSTCSLGGTSAFNYSLTQPSGLTGNITERALAVRATGINKAYDGNTDATVTLSDDRLGGDDLAVSYASAAFAEKNVGTGKPVSVIGISISGPDATNYSASASASATADIIAKALFVSANAKSKTYGESDPILTFDAAGLVPGDAIAGSLMREPGENAGTYDILQGSLDAGANYAINFTTAAFTIGKADQTIVFEVIADKTTADAPFGLTASATSGLPISFSSLSPDVATVSGSTVTILTTGSATIRATQTGDANHSAAPDVERTFLVGLPPNQPPVFSGMTATTLVGSPVMLYEAKILARTSDPENETVSIAAVATTTSGGGSVSRTGGTITYTPAAAYTGNDSISVTLTDGTNPTVVQIAVVVESIAEFSSGNPARITVLPGGGNRISFSGIPGRTYGIHRSTNMSNWTKVGESTASENSTVNFDDPTPPQPSVFYRIAYPAR
jgi:hypothetical protein